ncbi:MAG TPA: TIGR03751 family conjugal transfer lipoprotein [Leucothrix sp.]|nr:TIGR03751 family conjugal transfer lipoprotein [Leucothrix sp.]
MEMKHIITVLPISLVFSVFLGACTTTPKASIQPKKSKTIADIMQGQTGKSALKNYRKKPSQWQTSPAYQVNPMSYTRSEAKELHGLFPRLSNPDLCMYIYPHLSLENATVPGYSSCFSLYDQNHYALPGEAPATRSVR